MPDEARRKHGQHCLGDLCLSVHDARGVLTELNLLSGYRYLGPARDMGIPDAVGQLQGAVRQLSELITPKPPTPEVNYPHLDGNRDWVRDLPPEAVLWVVQAAGAFEKWLPSFAAETARWAARGRQRTIDQATDSYRIAVLAIPL
jgi:hypothetical protein